MFNEIPSNSDIVDITSLKSIKSLFLRGENPDNNRIVIQNTISFLNFFMHYLLYYCIHNNRLIIYFQ